MSAIWPLWIVIPNWNMAAVTIECVNSIMAAMDDSLVRIVVVDNGSGDDSPALLRSAFGGRIDQVVRDHNDGFAAAVNAGIRAALQGGAAAVLVLNNDTIVAPDALAELNEAAIAHPEAGILGPAIYYADEPARIWRLGDRQSTIVPLPYRIADREADLPVVPVDYLTGCAMLIRRPVLERVGLLDEQFFMYYEDADYCRRARTLGCALLCIPRARVWHKVSLSARRSGRTTAYWRGRGQVIFYRKHNSGPAGWLIGLYIWIKTAAMAALQAGLRHDGEGARASLRGTWDGYRLPIQKRSL